jgi:hypothetical protein
MNPVEDLIRSAEWYQKEGQNLPADLYYSLIENGIDASLYNDNPNLDYDEGNHHDET